MRATILVCSVLVLLSGVAPAFERDFTKVKGHYQGLYYAPDPLDAVHDGSCYFSFAVQSNGRAQGHLFLGGRGADMETYLDKDCNASFFLTRGDFWDDWEILGFALFHFDPSGTSPIIHGDVGVGADVSVSGYRCTFDRRTNPAPQAGYYTVILPGPENVEGIEGSGFASVSVDPSGLVNLNGTLPDGKPLQQRTYLSSSGNWPLFVNLHRAYNRQGSILGWLQFGLTDSAPIAGTAIWTRPPAKPDANRKVALVDLASSRYVAPNKGERVLDFEEGMAIFAGADLSQPITNTFILTSKNQGINQGPGRFSLTVASRTGTFSGSFTDPVSRRKFRYKGALLQDSNTGLGLFWGTEKRTGSVWLGPGSPRE